MPLPPPFPQLLESHAPSRQPFLPNNEPLPSVKDIMRGGNSVELPSVEAIMHEENSMSELAPIGDISGHGLHLPPLRNIGGHSLRFPPIAHQAPAPSLGNDLPPLPPTAGPDAPHDAPGAPWTDRTAPENMRSHPIAPVPPRRHSIQRVHPPGGHSKPQVPRPLLPKPGSSHNTPGAPSGTEHIVPGTPQKVSIYRITVLHVNLRNRDLKKVAKMDFTFPAVGHFTRQRVGNTLSGVFGSIGSHSTDYTNDECNDSADDTGTTMFVIQGGACDGDWPCIAWRQVNGDQHEFSVYKIDPEKTPPGRFPNIPRQRDGQPSKRPKNPPDPELDEDFWKIFPQKAFEAAWAGLKKAIEDYKQRGRGQSGSVQ
ncbi:hypothetical protein BDP27DRAFT_1367961 [Rhodocollybia butyracea]|uniref:Uncharacterized protein n=1 Tax=Rhodocollybia butyracea TaxID=206335 RepID=A0A9P5U2F4_9AGAR|nr:hypothetical protein BDP27DRAFT_1367961 [Rhodocollybia butyracea]